MIVYKCDLCNEIRDCTQRDIGDKEYDICSQCWTSLLAKLEAKGRSRRIRDCVTLPTYPLPEAPHEPKQPPMPGAQPTIYDGTDQVN